MAAICLPLVVVSCSTSLPRLDSQVRETVTETAGDIEELPPNTLDNALVELSQPEPTTGSNDVLQLDLGAALELSTRHSRSLQKRRDDLYVSGLALLGTRRDFAVELAGTLGYVFTRDITGEDTNGGEFGISAGRILPTGGRIRLSAQSQVESLSLTNLTRSLYGNSATLRVDQPLLSGAGYSASHEGLIQGEQDLIYAVRSFASDRQDFSVQIMRDYYDLVIQKAILHNTRLNVEQSTTLRKRSEAMFEVSRAPSIDVLRARQQELVSINDLNLAEAEFDVAIRQFLLTLGLPVDRATVVSGELPEPGELTLDEQDCVDSAMRRRLDLKTVTDQVVDARRQLKQAQNILRPDLSLYGEVELVGEQTESLSDQELEDRYNVGLVLDIPFDRRDERDAVKTAMLALADAIREEATKTDEVRLEVQDNFTNLRFLKEAVKIEAMNIDIAQKRAANAMFLFKNGELLNRDVVEAENDLLSARNAYVRILARYEIQRIELVRNSGALDIAPDGTFIETWKKESL
jgi:outer membrane protein TolC